MALTKMAPTFNSVKPVFIRIRDLPATDNDDRFTTTEICSEAEKSLGHGTMEGAQQIGGLWRVYPKTQAARMQLLVSGLPLRKVNVRFHDENPFLVRNPDTNGARVETTKLVISNIPLSFSNQELENAIVNLKCQLVSKLVDECDRDKAGRLTRWKTGRRFIFIAVPAVPLPSQINIGPFTARLYHREQKANRQPFCGNCLQAGHRKDECKAEVVCRRCHKSGHKSGDILCQRDEEHIQDSGPGETTSALPEKRTSDSESESEAECIEQSGDDAGDGEMSSSHEGESLKKKKKKKRKKLASADQSADQSAESDSADRCAKKTNGQASPKERPGQQVTDDGTINNVNS